MISKREGESTNRSVQSTWGYLDESGSWSIDIALGGIPLDAFANELAQGLMKTFIVAFEHLCNPKEVRYERVLLGDADRIVDEKDERFVFDANSESVSAHFVPTVGRLTKPWVIATAFLRCDTVVTLPQLESSLSSERVPDSGEFYLGFILETDENGGSRIGSCRVAFQTSIDAWVRKTRDPVTWTWRDNSVVAKCNQPFLSRALRGWEQGTGNPITEWVSRHYPEQIFHYGFT